ncbi:MAG: glycosyltransferase [Patescibacteria group bacterium]
MKIAQVVCVLPPYGGGIGVVAHFYAVELVKLFGHDVHVFTPSFKQLADDKRNYTIHGLRPVFRHGNAAWLPQLRWQLNNFDIIHLHYPFLGGAEAVYHLKKAGKIKNLVISYHMDLVGAGVKSRILQMYSGFHTHRVLDQADRIIAASLDYVLDSSIREYYLSHKEKFVELPFGVRRIYRPRGKDQYFIDKYKIKKEDKVLLFVAGLDAAHYFKGVNYLIDAMKYLDDNFKLIIAGEGDLKKDYIEQSKNLGLERRVHFAGYVDKELLPEYYNLADLFVLPSIDKSEAFGLVLIEALASGVPVIASNLKGVRTVVDSGRCGLLFQPKNSRDIAEKAKIILNNPKIHEQFAKNAATGANRKYRWPNIVSRLNDIYTELI